ncbi:putative membrane protein YfcA [Frigoribacterium sp. PvP120]|uniref:TSUP family transporter n=1 Tax=unclassified Frigoribacterium TaxID=2627005 RepID=UPI001AE52843|nr:TSUP family transporter [Frigoribacterium sp. PvP121]MBP1240443.1 putative membrane protein YfcA [Frigoribacterium sp. PvP121]
MDWLGVAVLLVVAVGAACQVASGLGFALVCSPLLVLVLGHGPGVRVVLVMSIVLNLVVLARSWRHVRLGDALRLLVPAALFVVPTALLAQSVRTPLLSLLAGSVVVVATVLVIARRELRWLDGTRGAVAAGAASGVFNTLAAASGPPVAIFAAQRRWEPRVMSATLQAFSLPLNLVTLAVLVLVGDGAGGGAATAATSAGAGAGAGAPAGLPLAPLAWAVVGLLAGAAAGVALGHRVPAPVVRAVALGVALLGGATLVTTGLTGLL